ncbi:hypothetical protein [Frigoribacterium faeni]|uniref:Holin n=1 Tax=Frigoribacterium faeni TaxID=145483 RepID=A0A7W3PI81_9MICO|nr:hypothetical protein [Frigoribacterium faeni]MBA8812651.1 hypothetical protein [Frigoribacterium faeni]BFF13761.1 hypothetical protein GCM10025699_50640 [Microbacterium flavescens]GEK82336.1 hypothetical protein FFA01_06450 [Frigoribacterium faeni]
MTHVDTIRVQEIWFKTQRALRTGAQVLVSGALLLAGVSAVAPAVLEAVQDVLPGPAVVWLTGSIATLAAVSTALARVMAIPAVNQWLTKVGLGSVPRSSVES